METGDTGDFRFRDFRWDPEKNRLNRLKHGLSFADAVQMFDGPTFIVPDDREDYGEDRWIALGLLQLLVVVIVFTQPDENTIRLISARKAERHEQRRFFESL